MPRKKRFDIGSVWKGKKQPKAVCAKRSAKIKEMFLAGKWKPWNSGKKLGKKHKERLRKSNILSWRDKKLRLKMGRIKKEQYKNPELRRVIDKNITKWWKEHPNLRKEYAIKAKKYFAKNPKMFQKFLSGGRNAVLFSEKTKSGYLVRSKPEKKIADYFFESKIKAEYESKMLQLDGWLCVPDFFLPKYGVYIEYYGGYPGSWKKKVIKNKLYKKYKIKVVSVTPSELDYLDDVFNDIIKLSEKRGKNI